MKIELYTGNKPFSVVDLWKKNYCAINRHHFLKERKDYIDLNKRDSYENNKYVIADIDSVFNSISELGKRIYEKYPNIITSIFTLQPINDNTRILKLLYKWIKLNGFPYYLDESLGAIVSDEILLRFARDSILIYLFNYIHKLCVVINKAKNIHVDDLNTLIRLLKVINLDELLRFTIDYNISTNALPEEGINYGKELLNSLDKFIINGYIKYIPTVNNILIYIVATEIYHRDVLDAFMNQPVFNNKNMIVLDEEKDQPIIYKSMIVLDTYNSLVGVAYHKLIAKITNINVEEIRCRNCKAWVPCKSKEQKYCNKKECQKARDNNKTSRKNKLKKSQPK